MAGTAIDLRTFIVINGTMAILMALVLFFQSRTYPKSVLGLRKWSAGQFIGFVATVLYSLQGTLPLLWSSAFANMLLVSAEFMLLHGTVRHYGQHLHRALPIGLLVLCVPLFVWLSAEDAYYVYRLMSISTILGSLFLAHAYVVWKHGDSKFAARFTLTVLLLLFSVMVLRGVTAFLNPPSPGLFAPSVVQIIYLASFSFGLLLLAIGGILMASQRLHYELEQLASKDSLTGAYNRRALYELGENEVARVQRQESPLSILMLDLDHFKAINDAHGHQVGDEVLIEFAKRLQSVLRKPAVLGRYGGEEFVALLPDTKRDEARLVAQRMLEVTASESSLPKCTVSIGLATFQTTGEDTLQALISRADAALYRAKHLGRNRVEEDAGLPTSRPAP
jgi:diguanylate cyclase (GGDEF)-like protein